MGKLFPHRRQWEWLGGQSVPGTRSTPGDHDQATRCRLCYVGGAYQALGLVVAARSVGDRRESSLAEDGLDLRCSVAICVVVKAGSRMNVWPSARKGLNLHSNALSTPMRAGTRAHGSTLDARFCAAQLLVSLRCVCLCTSAQQTRRLSQAGENGHGDSDGAYSDDDAFMSARENNSDWYKTG